MAPAKLILLGCAAAVAVDLVASALVTLASAPREGTCEGPFYLCSFRDLLPASAVRIVALVITWCAALLLTRQRKGAAGDGGDDDIKRPLLRGTTTTGQEDGLEAMLEADQRSQSLAQASKTACIVLCYAITVASQVYVALKVGLFKDHTLFKAPPAPLETVHGQPLVSLSGVIPLWTIPFGLVMTVLGVNMEAMAFAALVNDVWYPKPYSCPSLHIHPLDYEPKKVAMSCKSCGKNIRQGFKVAFSCRKCGYTCCLACYRKKMVEEAEGRTTQSAQEAEVSTSQLAALMVRLVSSEIPLVIVSMVCVLVATLLDNMIPDVQGKIFSDLYAAVPSALHGLPIGSPFTFTAFFKAHPAIAVFFDDLLNYLYFLLASMLLGNIKSQTFRVFGLRLTSKLQKQLFGKILTQDTDFFDSASVGDLASRLTREVPGMLDPVSTILPETISSAGGLVIGIYYCFSYSWKLSLCCFATIPPIIHVSRAYAKWASELWKQQFVGWGMANSICNEAFSNIRTVHSFSTEEHEKDKYTVQMDQMLKFGLRGAFGTGSSAFINGLLAMTTNMLVLGYGGYLVLLNMLGIVDTGFDAGKLIAYQLYMNKMQGAFKLLQNQINNLTQATGAAQRVVGLLESMPEDENKPGISAVTMGEVQYENVRFAYKSRPDVEVLKGLDLIIPGGTTCGIVGTSGAGKSTVLSLLMQFYKPTSGRLLVDGQDLSLHDRCTTHKYMGIVTQETQLFACSIEENIAYGLEGYTREDLMEAARQAYAHDFISEFPEGYGTLVGERGVLLSGGQKQRIALARLLIRKPKVVLLDEATSALDAESEAAVQVALDALMAAGGRTIVIVAHRLSTVKDANKIAVMDQGQVAEMGPHQDLVAMGGIYSRLVRRQLEGLSSLDDVLEASAHELPAGRWGRGRGGGRMGGRGSGLGFGRGL